MENHIAIKSRSPNESVFPYWKIHSRSGNFNRRLELKEDCPKKWKSWGKSISENTKYLTTFVKREGNKESNVFYEIWKYSFLRSKESIKKIFTKTQEKWEDRAYVLLSELNNLRPSIYRSHSTLFEIVGLDETTRLNLYVSQSIQSEQPKPENWRKCFQRGYSSLARKNAISISIGRNYKDWDWCYRRIKRGFIGNHYGAWNVRFKSIKSILEQIST